jgi:hypothetical protein
VICVETEGAAGQPPTLTRLDAEPAATSAIPEIWAEPLLFMHERRTTYGDRKLVLVRRTMPALRDSMDLPTTYSVWVFDADGSSGRLGRIIEVLPHPFDMLSPGTSIRFFAGQPDPSDDSHFTIGYQANGRPGIIDGYLIQGSPGNPDDHVELEDRGLSSARAR